MFFLNFRLSDFPGKLRTDIVLSDRDTLEIFSDKLRFIFIELPAFTKEEEECETDFERWIYILKNMETLNRLPFKARKEEREKYDESIKVYRDQLVTITYAREEGIEEGIEKGRAEEKFEIARKMRALKLPVETIMKATGLSAEEIGEL